MNRMKLVASCTLVGLALCPTFAAAEGNAARGETLFSRCSACHTLNGKNRAGPSLAGVLGRKAGAVEGARYSKALSQSELVWNEENLDAYLTAPATLVRGTTMTMRITNGQDRQDIIAYLKSLGPGAEQ